MDKPTQVQYDFSEVRNCVLDKTSDIQEIGHFSITDMPALPFFLEEEGTDHFLYAVTIKNQQDAKLVNVDDPNDKIDLTFYEDAGEVSIATIAGKEFELAEHSDSGVMLDEFTGDFSYIFIDSLNLDDIVTVDGETALSDKVLFINGDPEEDADYFIEAKNKAQKADAAGLFFVNIEDGEAGDLRVVWFTSNTIPIGEIVKGANAELKKGTKHTVSGVDYYTGEFSVEYTTQYPEFTAGVYGWEYIEEELETPVFVQYNSTALKENATYEYTIEYELYSNSFFDEIKGPYSISQTTKLFVSTKNTFDFSFNERVNLDVEELFLAAKNETKPLTLKVGSATLEFDSEAVSNIATSIGDSKLSINYPKDVEGAEKVIDIDLSGVTFGNGIATVSFAFDQTPSEGQVAKLYYIDGENKVDMNATFTDGRVTFSTGHFSKFAVFFEGDPLIPGGEETPTSNETPEKKGMSGGLIFLIVFLSILVLALGGFSVYWFVIKKKSFNELVEQIKVISKKVWAWIKKTAIAFGGWVKKITLKCVNWIKSLFKKKD